MDTEFEKNLKPYVQIQLKGSMYQKYLKRLMDFILSLLAIIILSPIFLVLTILVRSNLGSPVIFKQKRPGFNEKIFNIYKFRTMTEERNKKGNLLPDNLRLTRFGKLLRATSLDELPEVFNILKGDMSVVGPRPQLVKDLVFMSPQQRLRHTVRPGLSGWAQVNGRNGLTWEEKLELDREYLEKISFQTDCKIILMTFVKVFKQEGISAKGMDTAEDYGDFLLKEQKISPEEYYAALGRVREYEEE